LPRGPVYGPGDAPVRPYGKEQRLAFA
jgi:hypothetical protein